MAFPTTGVLDTFTGTNGNALSVYSPANWAILNSHAGEVELQIQGNAATGIGTTDNLDYWKTTYGPDSEVFITVATKPLDNGFINIQLRVQQPGGDLTNDGYAFEMDPVAGTDNSGIYRVDNNVFTLKGTQFSQEWSAGDKMGLECIGSVNNLKAYRNTGGVWSQLGSTQSDATYQSSGNLAIDCSDTTVRLDDFGGGTVVAAAQQQMLQLLGVGA